MTNLKNSKSWIKMAIAGSILAVVAIVSPVSLPVSGSSFAHAADDVSCEASDVQINWGTLDRWRAYVGGSIAKGSWATEGDVSYEIPEFVWTGGSGDVAEDGSAGDFKNSGSVDFRGHNDLLQVVIANPSFVFEGERAALKLDYTATDMEGVEAVKVTQVESASFDIAGGVTVAEDSITIAGVNGVLTAEGVDAFGGFYDEGEPVDDITVKAKFSCVDSSANENNSGATGEKDSEKTPADESASTENPADSQTTAEPESGFPIIPVAIGGAVIIALGAGALVAKARKRNPKN